MADSAAVKTSWADDVEVEELETPKVEDYVDEDGIRVTVEYTVNDEGKKVKVRALPGMLCCVVGWLNTSRYIRQDHEEDQACPTEITCRPYRCREETMDKVRKGERCCADVLFFKPHTNILYREQTWSRPCYHNSW